MSEKPNNPEDRFGSHLVEKIFPLDDEGHIALKAIDMAKNKYVLGGAMITMAATARLAIKAYRQRLNTNEDL